MKTETIYISGSISKNPNYLDDFKKAEQTLKKEGFGKILNPIILPSNLEYEQLMVICFAMIDASDIVYMLSNWEESDGAFMEYHYAISKNKDIIFE